MNRRARDAFKAAKMEYRTADAEAEDQNTAMAIDSDKRCLAQEARRGKPEARSPAGWGSAPVAGKAADRRLVSRPTFCMPRRIRNRVMRTTHGNTDTEFPFSMAVSNITGVHTKLPRVAMHALSGIHAVTETKADRMTQIRMDQELNALNEMNGPNKQVQVLWGEPVGETRSGGIALFLGPGAVGHAMRLTGGGPKAAEWRSKCRLEAYKITLQSGKRSSNDLGLVFLHVFVVYGVYGDAAATNSILRPWTNGPKHSGTRCLPSSLAISMLKRVSYHSATGGRTWDLSLMRIGLPTSTSGDPLGLLPRPGALI